MFFEVVTLLPEYCLLFLGLLKGFPEKLVGLTQFTEQILKFPQLDVFCILCQCFYLFPDTYYTRKQMGFTGKESFQNAENKEKKALFLCTFQLQPGEIFIAFGWSISIPDISQSNSLQDRFLTSDLSLGHRYRPWAVSLL